jgi:hypothetical protein
VGPPMIILLKAGCRGVAYSHLSPVQPVDKDCVGDTNVQSCPQLDLDDHIKYCFI